MWSFGKDYARNAIIFGVDNSSSFHSNNCRDTFVILGEGDTFVLMEFSISFSKAKTKFC